MNSTKHLINSIMYVELIFRFKCLQELFWKYIASYKSIEISLNTLKLVNYMCDFRLSSKIQLHTYNHKAKEILTNYDMA